VRTLLAGNFDAWVRAVEQCFEAAADRFPERTSLRSLAELALSVMEGGVMLARTHRDIAYFDRAVAQLRGHLESLMQKAGEAA
jgi:hypothetical protein